MTEHFAKQISRNSHPPRAIEGSFSLKHAVLAAAEPDGAAQYPGFFGLEFSYDMSDRRSRDVPRLMSLADQSAHQLRFTTHGAADSSWTHQRIETDPHCENAAPDGH